MPTSTFPLRKYPIGVQSFERLIADGFFYIDKTELLYNIANNGAAYFLSRPRRFGKSLLLSTFKAYFEGKRELFKGLAIDQLEQVWTARPVLYLDLNAEKYESVAELDSILERHLRSWELCYGEDSRDVTLSDRFIGVIRRARQQSGERVVVLVDEYDKPLLQTISNSSLQQEYKSILKAFYGVLKSADEDLRFVFLTGVTKFGQVSVFSDLNQLKDISMSREYSAVCGITQAELTTNLSEEIARLGENRGLGYDQTVQLLATQYNGYRFNPYGTGVYNPFSLLNALADGEINSYWFQTGTPTFLMELLKDSEYDLRNLDGIELDAASFADYRADADEPIPVIYQSGYLTIQSYDPEVDLYTLGYPNEEVKYGFLKFMLPHFTKVPTTKGAFYIGKFVKELRVGDVEGFMNRMRAFFADFPYDLNVKSERHYQVVFYLVFKLLGQFVDAEVRSAKGRADAVVKTKDQIYVFEFKLNGTAEEALKQIDERGYLIPYTIDGRELVKIGASFSAEERNIDRWLVG